MEIVRESISLLRLTELSEQMFGGLVKAEFVEFDSMINIRPGQGNRPQSVEDPEARAAILTIVERLVS